MTPTPLISVILPTYNRLEFLPETVESILNQSLSDFELIIINDGSTDGTEQWVNEQTDPRIQYISYPKNQGVSFARNKGLDIARGKYIAFADSDDINDPKRFEEQVALLESDEGLAVCGSYIEFFGLKNRKRIYHQKFLSYKILAIFEIPFHFPASMVRRSFLEKENIRFRPEIRSADDYYFLMKIVTKGGRAEVIQKYLYKYRWHESSISLGKTEEQKMNEIAINRLAFKDVLKVDLSDAETKLIHRVLRYQCKQNEAESVEQIVHKISRIVEKSPHLDKNEKRDLLEFLMSKKLAFEKKRIQLLILLIKQRARRLFR